MSNETASLIISVDATSSERATASLLTLTEASAGAEAAIGRLGQTSAGLSAINTSAASASQGVQGLTNDFGDLGNAILKFGLYLATFEALKTAVEDLVEAQTAVQRITYTLESVTGSATAAAAEFKFLQDTAQLLGVNLQSSALQYSRLESASQAANVPLDQTRALFVSLSTAATSLGLPVNNVNRALYALQEILDKNVVQARQFRQMLAIDIPGIGPIFQRNVEDWAKNVAHLTGSFDDLMKKGELVASDMVPILIKSFTQLSNPGALLQTTDNITSNINRLSNAWFTLRAQVSGGLFNDAVNSSLKTLADNLGTIADVATVGAGILITRFGGQALGGLTASLTAATKATIDSVAASDAYAEMSLESAAATARRTEAQVAQATSQVEQTAATLTAVQAARADAETALVVAQAKTAEARATVAATEAIGAAAVTVKYLRDAQAQLVIATEAESAAIAELALLGQQQARVEAQVIAATDGLITAEEADVVAKTQQIAATEAYTVATSASTVAMGALATVGRGMLSLIGGVPGLFIAAAAGIYYFVTQTDEAEKTLNKLDDVLQRVKESGTSDVGVSITLLGAGLQKLSSQAGDLQPKIESLRSEIADTQKQLSDAGVVDEYGSATASLGAKLEQLTTDYDKTIAKQKEFSDQLALLEQQLITGASAGGGSASQITFLKDFEKELDNLSKQQAKFSEDAATHGMGNAAKVQYEAQKEAAAIVKQYTGDTVKLNEALKTLSDAYGPAYEAAVKYDAVLAEQKGAKQAESEYDRVMKSLEDQAVRLQFNADNYKKYGVDVETATEAVIKFRLAQGDLKNLSPDQKQDVLDAVARARSAQNAFDLAKEKDAYKNMVLSINAQASAIGQTNVELQYQKDIVELIKKGLQEGTPEFDRQAQGLRDALNAADFKKAEEQLRLYVQQQETAIASSEVLAAHTGDNALQQEQLNNELKAYADIQAYSVGKTQEEIDAYIKAREELLRYQNQAAATNQALRTSAETGFKSFFSTLHDEAINSAKTINTALTDTFNTLSNAIAQFVTTGKLNFASLVSSILADLVKLETNQLFAQLISSLGSSFFGGAAAAGSGASSVGAGAGAAAAGYGTAAVGSPVRADSITQVNERGTELFNQGGKTYLLNGDQGGTVIPASQSPSGNQTNNIAISVNVESGNTKIDGAEQGRQLGLVIKQAIQSELVKQKRPGGILATA